MKNSFDQIPQSFISKWQGIADLLAKIIGVPAALIMKVENEYMEVFISSKSDNNPYHVGDKEHWNGLYCETVIKSQNKLKVPNALKDEKWDKNPDIKLGMVSYFGFPLNFPDGEPFGTICVLDRKENTYSEEYDQLLMQFKSVVELDLAMIQSLKITQDISENELVDRLLLQNKALIKSEERFRSLAEIAADSIILFEGEKLVFASHRFCEYVGIEPENIDKLTVSEVLSHIHPDDIMHYVREMQEALAQQKKQYTILFRMLNPEGKYEWLQNNTTATYDSYGKALRRIVQVRDITQKVEMEIKLRELNAQKDKFFSIIAHDLTNPFNTIIGFIDLLIEEIPEKDYEKIEEYAKLIEQSSQQTMSLLTNLLEWSRANTGSIAYYPDFIELNVLIEENKTLLDFVAAQKGITIKTKLSQNLTVYAYKPMISTVLRNLISNAIKFTNRGGEIIVAADKMGEEIIVSVSDNGIGISHERLEKIFRIDENNSTPGTNKEKGTGLGLILCKEFIEKHGGKIWVESEQGMGTVFYFTVFSNSR